MNKLKSFTILSLTLAAPFFAACDGGGSSSSSDGLDGNVARGLDLTEITNNPAGTPGFPYTLEGNETIEFTPGAASPFTAEVPLDTWTVSSSGLVRQNHGSTGSLYYPVSENTFQYYYGTTNPGSSPETVSTQTTAFLEYSDSNRVDRSSEFVPAMEDIYRSSSAPGSLQHALTSFGLVESTNRIVIDAISSLDISAVNHPDFGLAVRTFRSIELTNITSTNADLAGNNPIITGTYTLTDSWARVVIGDSEGNVTLDHDHNNGAHLATNEELEVSTGTFVIRLNGPLQ